MWVVRRHGSLMTNAVPDSGAEVTLIVPECASTIFLTINKPMPKWLNSLFGSSCSVRLRGGRSKSVSRAGSGMGAP